MTLTLAFIITLVWLLAAWRIVGAGWRLVRLAEQRLPAGNLLERIEWLFPIRGRWLQYLLGVLVIAVGLLVFILIALVWYPVFAQVRNT